MQDADHIYIQLIKLKNRVWEKISLLSKLLL
jgi:hypothetical protein